MKLKTIGIMMIITGLIVYILLAMLFTQSTTHTEQTKCYDKFGSEILNQTCSEIRYDSPIIDALESFSILIAIFPLATILFGILYLSEGVMTQ